MSLLAKLRKAEAQAVREAAESAAMVEHAEQKLAEALAVYETDKAAATAANQAAKARALVVFASAALHKVTHTSVTAASPR